MTLKLLDIIDSPSAVSPRAGIVAYDFVLPLLSKGDSIEVSLAGIKDFTTTFCNSFIGKLYMNLDPALLKARLHVTDIPQDVWQRKIDTAIHLGTNEGARKQLRDNLDKAVLS
jgi:hypothetical protein